MLAPTNQNRTFPVSRKWQTVSKAIQKLAAGMYAVKSEGMFPYELTTCWQPMKKSSDCTSAKQRWMRTCGGSSVAK